MEPLGKVLSPLVMIIRALWGLLFRGREDKKEDRAALFDIRSLLLSVKAAMEDHMKGHLGQGGFAPGPTPLERAQSALKELDEKAIRLGSAGRFERLLRIRTHRTRFIDDLDHYRGDEQRANPHTSLNRVCGLIMDLESLLGIQKSAQSPPSP